MTVSLLAHMGDDLTIVNAARVSYHRESRLFGESDAGLLRFLIRQRHTSPFEQVEFQFRVRVPIRVAREWFRHRMGEFNEESTRYVRMRPDFYTPAPTDVRAQTGKPGAYTFESVSDDLARDYVNAVEFKHHVDYAFYERWLAAGIAREVTAFELPMSLLTEFIWKANLHSLFNFLSLRTAPNALLEIRREAEEVERLITPIVPVTMAAWRAELTKASNLGEDLREARGTNELLAEEVRRLERELERTRNRSTGRGNDCNY